MNLGGGEERLMFILAEKKTALVEQMEIFKFDMKH